MLSSQFKKILSLSAFSISISPIVASATVQDLRLLTDFENDITVAAHDLVEKIKEDPNNNHSPIPGHNAYRDLKLTFVDPNYTGSVEVDDVTGFVKHVNVTSVSFKAEGVSMFSKYEATLSLSVDMTPDCRLVDGTRIYTILRSNSSLVDALFKKDLTGRNYKYEAYADTLFHSLFSTSSALRALCHPDMHP